MNIIPPEITPNKSQEQAIEKLERFLKSDEKFFILVGPAGYGKTTTIKMALADLLSDSRQSGSFPNVYGVTVAHQAKNILAPSVKGKVATFAKAYGFKEVIDEITGEREFVHQDKKYLDEEPIAYLSIPVFVHDEVSMYSHKMMKIVIDNLSPFSKIIFMGDNAQLPPIDKQMKVDEDSPIFNMPVPSWCKHTLDEPIRQKEGNPILDLGIIIREEIFGNKDILRVMKEIVNPRMIDGKGYDLINQSDLYNYYINKSQGDYLNNKLIAFRKNAVAIINNDIRNILFNNSPKTLIENDVVCLTNNFMVDNGVVKFYLENSQNFNIHEVVDFDFKTGYVNFSIPCHYGYLDKNKYKHIVVPQVEGLPLYNLAQDELLRAAKLSGKEWKSYWNFRKLFTEITMGYAVNAYRSQGSTYKNVYLDLVDILDTKPLTVKRKLQTIYTGITRATDTVMFIQKNR